MSIARFCDHRVLVHRPVETRDEFGDTVLVYEPVAVPTGMNGTLHRNWGGSLQDHGPGEQQATTRQWFLLPGFDVRERDVLEAVAGPETGTLYKVESVSAATGPITVHHYEAIVSIYNDSLPETTAS